MKDSVHKYVNIVIITTCDRVVAGFCKINLVDFWPSLNKEGCTLFQPMQWICTFLDNFHHHPHPVSCL
jgi:hypothetical protein